MKLNWLVIPMTAMVVLTCGCATIVSGTTQKVHVVTNPSGADAKADGNVTFKTPAHITLERRQDHTIEISKEGYKTVTVYVRKAFNEMMTGNILIGGIIGAGIDAASGSTNKLIPEKIDIVLEAGAGQADMPKFASEKDQQFYETQVLKNKKTADDAATASAKPAEQASAKPVSQPATNFGPSNS